MSNSGNQSGDAFSRNIIGRIRGSHAVQWILLSGGRFTVATAILVGLVVVIAVGFIVVTPSLGGDRMRWLFNGLVNGLLSLITLVLTINQLIISRQLGSPRDLYDRLDDRIDFRKEVEDQTGSVIAPSQPDGFMRLLFRALRGKARTLEHARTTHNPDREIQDFLTNFTGIVYEQTDQITATLKSNPFEMAGLLALVDYDDTRQFHLTRRLETIHWDSLSDDQQALVEDIGELLRQIETGRQYFKTLYIQRELAQMSRQIVYVGSVAILVSSATLLFYGEEWGFSLGYRSQILVLSIATGLTLYPVGVVFAHALRIATVTRRTVVFGPFTPQEEQEESDGEWNL